MFHGRWESNMNPSHPCLSQPSLFFIVNARSPGSDDEKDKQGEKSTTVALPAPASQLCVAIPFRRLSWCKIPSRSCICLLQPPWISEAAPVSIWPLDYQDCRLFAPFRLSRLAESCTIMQHHHHPLSPTITTSPCLKRRGATETRDPPPDKPQPTRCLSPEYEHQNDTTLQFKLKVFCSSLASHKDSRSVGGATGWIHGY